MTLSPAVRYLLRYVALAYVVMLVIVPVALILWRTFSPASGRSSTRSVRRRRSRRCSCRCSWWRSWCRSTCSSACPPHWCWRATGSAARVLQAVIDLPFAVSPVVVGVALILLWGSAGLFGFVENDLGLKIIFGFPGIVLASIFVTVPFVIREVEPVLHELGTDQEEAAATLGSQWWQTFWRITLPSIRWGLTYGVVLTIARTLGEFGAVIMVSSNLPGTSQTLTLLVADRYNRGARIRRLCGLHAADGVAVIVLDRSGDPRRPARASSNQA